MSALGVLLVAAFCFGLGWFFGFASCGNRVYRMVLRPWSDARPVGDPHYWVRARDWAAAWRGYCVATALPGLHADMFSSASDTFDRKPQGLCDAERQAERGAYR